MADNTGLSSFV